MPRAFDRLLARHRISGWIALATGGVLLIPLIAMQFSREVDWSPADFAIMGALLFTAATTFVLIARRIPRPYRWPTAALITAAFLIIWAELAVGVFTPIGS